MSLSQRHPLYPPIEPYAEGRLAVGDGHELYYAECGNPAGEPVLVVHGGPGGGCNATMRRFHDPKRYRIVLFDQRGCGRSVPHASLEANTTWHLVADMELLRRALRIDRWQLFGGSWGSTLAIAYASRYPDRVAAMVLRGIFLLRKSDLDWFYQEGASAIFPEAWDAFCRVIPQAERGDMIAAYHRRLTDPNAKIHLPAAEAWSVWEGSTLSMVEDPGRIRVFAAPSYALAFARIEAHYFVNGGFFGYDGELLDLAKPLRTIPSILVHGRYDVVTPVKGAFDLKKLWPDAELHVVPDAGHAMTEPGIVHELIAATRRLSRATANPI